MKKWKSGVSDVRRWTACQVERGTRAWASAADLEWDGMGSRIELGWLKERIAKTAGLIGWSQPRFVGWQLCKVTVAYQIWQLKALRTPASNRDAKILTDITATAPVIRQFTGSDSVRISTQNER